jgi:hypothetical protein
MAFSGPLATFNDPISHGGQPDPTSEFTVMIDWGDGSQPTVGQVQSTSTNGDYVVSGTHTYSSPSGTTPFTITVTITDPSEDATLPPSILTLTTTAVVTMPTPP